MTECLYIFVNLYMYRDCQKMIWMLLVNPDWEVRLFTANHCCQPNQTAQPKLVLKWCHLCYVMSTWRWRHFASLWWQARSHFTVGEPICSWGTANRPSQYSAKPTACNPTNSVSCVYVWNVWYRQLFVVVSFSSGAFQHCSHEGLLYSYPPTGVPSFISRRAPHEAAWETSVSEGQN
jgi:hypothetical protein